MNKKVKNPSGHRIVLFDLLRCVAAVAVVTIHALGPYRHQFGQIPITHWGIAVTLNGLSRWAVPVFILITGALMLSDQRDFSWRYYMKRRVGKVVLPFLVWSLFYAYLSGWNENGFDADMMVTQITQSPFHETYYHLGFFYYFIPLYLVIPFGQYLIRQGKESWIYAWLVVWLMTTLLYLFSVNGWWSNELWLYSGYLLLGYVLYQKIPMTPVHLTGVVILGLTGLAVSVLMVFNLSLEAEQYKVGRWLSYKTINTVAAASLVFVVCQRMVDHLSNKAKALVGWLSRYSLGIYLLHPLFLWPMNTYGLFHGNPLWVIPFWVFLSGTGALLVSWLLSLSDRTRWLVP